VNITNPRAFETCPLPRHVEHVVGCVPGAAPDPEHFSQGAGY
jgi:hypothetical protein